MDMVIDVEELPKDFSSLLPRDVTSLFFSMPFKAVETCS